MGPRERRKGPYFFSLPDFCGDPGFGYQAGFLGAANSLSASEGPSPWFPPLLRALVGEQ